MAKLEAGRKSSQYIIKSIMPDVCITPGSPPTPVPYNISIKLDGAIKHSEDVNFKGEPAAMVALRCSPVKGNEQGTLGGVMSGVNMGWCRPQNFVPSVRVNGLNALFHNDTFCFMNCAGPDGPFNTMGKLYCLDDMATGPAASPDDPLAGDPPLSLTPDEARFLGADQGILAKIASTPGLTVELAKMAYGIAQNGLSTTSIVSGLGSIAGVAGLEHVAQAADLGLKAKAIADTDWNNPAVALGALGGAMGIGSALRGSPQLANLSKGLSVMATGVGALQAFNAPNTGAMMSGLSSIAGVRATAHQQRQSSNREQGNKSNQNYSPVDKNSNTHSSRSQMSEETSLSSQNDRLNLSIKDIAQQVIPYRQKVDQARSIKTALNISRTTLPSEFMYRLNESPSKE